MMRDTELAGLAMTLGKDHGMTITVGGEDSYCSADGSRINIARMPSTALGRQLMCGLIFHEVGHKNHTSGNKPAGLLGDLTNVIEDLRVEQLTMNERPGTRFDLEAVTTYYADKHPMAPRSVPVALLGLVMAIGRGQFLQQKSLLNWHAPCQQYLESTFSSKLVSSLEDNLIFKLPKLASTRDSQALANELITLVRSQTQAKQLPEQKAPGTSRENNGDEVSGSQKTQSQRSPAPPGSGTEESSASFSAEQIEELLAADSGDLGNIQKFLTEELNQLSAQTTTELRNALPEYPEILVKPTATAGLLNVSEALVASSRMRTHLPGLLQTLQQTPSSYGTYGRKISTSRLVHFANGNPKIFRKKTAALAANTAIVILLDNSGSMHAKRSDTSLFTVANPAAFALHHCLWGLPGVSVASIAFADPDNGPALQSLCRFRNKPQGEQFDLVPDGGTPTHTALWYSRAALLQRPEPRKIILLLTDGQPNDPDQTRQATSRCARDGIEIAAIGILSDAVKQYWDHHQVVERLQEFPRAVFSAMETLLASR